MLEVFRFQRLNRRGYRGRQRLWQIDALESRVLLSASVTADIAPLAAIILPQTTTSTSAPYTPNQIRTAYGVNQLSGNGAGQTIAIVDAYYDPTIASDVAQFDSTFGLPAFNQSGGPALSQVVQTANGRLPGTNSGWAIETALDVEWAHAIAPKANITLVEANTSSLSNLLASVQYAAAQTGVVAVSMSWGSSEFSTETAYDGTFTTPAGHIGGSGLAGGVAFIAASGDTGGQMIWPAASPNVLSAGGTSLLLTSTGAYGSETGWSGSGGGTSAFEPAPAFQAGVATNGMRSGPDVAYNADPSTGVYVYDAGNWYAVGGTSAAAPQWAGLVALADQSRAATQHGSLTTSELQSALYQLGTKSGNTDFHDITSGTAGGNSAHAGYDQVTGLGTPAANNLIPDLVAATASIGGGTGGTGGGGTGGGGTGGGGTGGGTGGGGSGGRHHRGGARTPLGDGDRDAIISGGGVVLLMPQATATPAMPSTGGVIAVAPSAYTPTSSTAPVTSPAAASTIQAPAAEVPFVKRSLPTRENSTNNQPGDGDEQGQKTQKDKGSPQQPVTPPKSQRDNNSGDERAPAIPVPTNDAAARFDRTSHAVVAASDACFSDFAATDAAINGGLVVAQSQPETGGGLLKQSAMLLGGLVLVLGKGWSARASNTAASRRRKIDLCS